MAFASSASLGRRPGRSSPRWSQPAIEQTIPTLGYKLVGESEGGGGQPSSLLRYIGALASTALFGDEQLKSRSVRHVHRIAVRVDVSTMQLDLTQEQRDKLYGSARSDAEE